MGSQRLLALAAFVAAAVLPAVAGAAAPAPAVVPATVLITATVGEAAAPSMPRALWRKIVVDYVAASHPVLDDEPTLADEARCRAAHAVYAVYATFDRAMRLPGLAQDTDRAYGIARFTVRNCISGQVSPPKVVNLESDPISDASRGDFEPNAERTWDRSVRASLAREPLIKPLARIVSVHNGVVLIERGPSFAINQIVRSVADASGQPRAAYELVILNVTGKFIEATIVGNANPHVGDFVEGAPPK